jgi:hypothetical protein
MCHSYFDLDAIGNATDNDKDALRLLLTKFLSGYLDPAINHIRQTVAEPSVFNFRRAAKLITDLYLSENHLMELLSMTDFFHDVLPKIYGNNGPISLRACFDDFSTPNRTFFSLYADSCRIEGGLSDFGYKEEDYGQFLLNMISLLSLVDALSESDRDEVKE